MAEKPVRNIPWIKYAYLKQMPSYDDALWIERKMTETVARLMVRVSFKRSTRVREYSSTR